MSSTVTSWNQLLDGTDPDSERGGRLDSDGPSDATGSTTGVPASTPNPNYPATGAVTSVPDTGGTN